MPDNPVHLYMTQGTKRIHETKAVMHGNLGFGKCTSDSSHKSDLNCHASYPEVWKKGSSVKLTKPI